MDRRKRKSRQAIFNACVALTKEKDFQSITVNEIVELADLNRGTFYLHFTDKFDMMSSFEDEMVEKIETIFLSHIPKQDFKNQFVQSRYDTIVHILQCYIENRELLQLIMHSGQHTSFQIKHREALKDVVVNNLLQKLEIKSLTIPIDLFVMCFTSISLNLLEYTYQTNQTINVEQLAKFLISIMIDGPAKTLGFISNENQASIFSEDELKQLLSSIQ